MPRPAGNRKLKAARLACGYGSQDGFASALTAAAEVLGLRGVGIGTRQVRRWESAAPPWPQPHHQQLLTHVLGIGIEELGFTPPWGASDSSPPSQGSRGRSSPPRRGSRRSGARRGPPASIASEFGAVTVAHRRMYWSVDPARLYPAVVEHARLGESLLGETAGGIRADLARDAAESSLLAGRIEFFDLRRPDEAAVTFVRAVQLAGESDDQLLGAAVLTHAAFVPGWVGNRDGAAERMAAARAYARRGGAPTVLWAWLDAVEVECLTRWGDTAAALGLISRAESALAQDDQPRPPDWMDWFGPVRLAAFKGNTQLKAGNVRRARETLVAALDGLPSAEVKQRSVLLGDLAAVEVAAGDVEEACRRVGAALDELGEIWYATGMERIREVRRSLRAHQDLHSVRELDDRLYGWSTTVNAISS